MEWMLLPIKRYAEFDGRSRRIEYWMFALLQILFILVAALIIGGAQIATAGGSDDFSTISVVLMGIIGLAYLGLFFIPNIAVTIRRWHDLDQTGWLLLVFALIGAIPFIGWIASIANIIWFCMRGTTGPNKYGDDPLDAPLPGYVQ